jgi:hypothetical protein
MNKLGNAFHRLLVWIGLADVSQSHMTPSYGWLLPVPVIAHREPEGSAVARAERILKTGFHS